MRHRSSVVLLFLIATSPAALAQNQQSYPTVIGPTGQPYGPTQAEYQYRLQYGHPSPGSHGNSGMEYVNGYPGGGSSGGYSTNNPYLFFNINPYLAPYQNYPPGGYVFAPSTAHYGVYSNFNYGLPYAQPYLTPPTPPVLQPLNTPGNMLFNNGSATFNHVPSLTNTTPIVEPSSPKAQEKSFEYQTQGDLQLQQLNYLAASERYRKAIDAARDRAEPRYRMAVTLAARSRFLEAVDQLKLAVTLDPTFPQHCESLDQLFGGQNLFEKTRVKQRVAEWTLQDARDPNRLFLLGALLYLDGDPNAKTILDTAVLISGNEEHLRAFLAPRTTPIAPGGKPDAAPLPNPPVPQPPQGQAPVLPTPVPVVPKQESDTSKMPRKPIPAVPPLPDEFTPPAADSSGPTTTDDLLNGPLLPPPP